jgi:hypothetical protein
MAAMLRYLRTFLPWIAFAVLSHGNDSRWGALTGLVIAAALLVYERRHGRPWDALIIEAGSALYFLVLAAAAVTIRPAPLGRYGAAASDAWLGLVVWGSLVIRRPFTLGIARTTTPPEVQANPLFHRINAVITAAWGVAFTAETAILVILAALAPHATIAVIAVQVAGFAAAAVFTARYPRVIVARARAAAGRS